LWKNSIWNKNNLDIIKADTFVKETESGLLSGRITDKATGSSLAGVEILLSVTGKTPFIDYSFTNSNGEFFFWLDSSLDNANIILQVFDVKIKNADVFWQVYNNNLAVENLSQTSILPQTEEKQVIDGIKQLSLVNRIYFDKKETQPEHEGIVPSTITYAPNYYIDPSDYEQLENFKDIAANILPGVAIKLKRKGWMLQVIDPKEKMVLDSGSMVLLNGVPFKNLEYIAKLPIDDIKRIDVYQSNFFYGRLNFQGIVAIYTHEKALPINYLANETFIFRNIVQPFADSVISNEPATNLFAPNFSNLLYWNPIIILGKDNSFIVEFSASLYKSQFEINIEGISNNRTPVSAHQSFIIE
jgi:hypothetical protein